MDVKASVGRGGGGSRQPSDVPAVLHNAERRGHAGDASSAMALEILRAEPWALENAGEPQLKMLDAHLVLDAVSTVDLLACDPHGTPVLVLFCDDDEGAALGRIGRVVGAFQRSGSLLRVAFGERGLDPGHPPRVLLMAPRFSDGMRDQLDLLGEVSASALEYRVVQPRGGEPLLDVALLHRSGGSGKTSRAPAVATPRTPRAGSLDHEPDELTSMELEPLAPDDLDGLLDRAHQSIVSLSEQVSAEQHRDQTRFLVDGRPLASLFRDGGAGTLSLTLDEEDGVIETLAICDEVSLHAALNALFDRYFQELDTPL